MVEPYDGAVSRPVLFLGSPDSPALAHLREVESAVVAVGVDAPVDVELIDVIDPEFAVVHNYRVILRAPVLERLPDRIVNLHISLLPWNRGADPNLWSILEDTPSGVSIHYVDAGVDTGDLIAQERVELFDDDTLRTSYARLQQTMATLFRAMWPAIRAGTCPRVPQQEPGSSHRVADRAAVEHLMTDGWDTRVGALRGVRR